jgi:hypothetical protein
MTESSPFYGANPVCYAVTVGTTSLQVIGLNPYRKKLLIQNPNPVAKIAVCGTVDQNGAPLPAVMNGKGSWLILPLSSLTLDNRPVAAMNAISDTPGAALTMFESV